MPLWEGHRDVEANSGERGWLVIGVGRKGRQVEGEVVGPEAWRVTDDSLRLNDDQGAWAKDAPRLEYCLHRLGDTVADTVAHGGFGDALAMEDMHAPRVNELATDADRAVVLLVLLKVELRLEIDSKEEVIRAAVTWDAS